MISLKKVFLFWESLTELKQSELLDNTIIRQYGDGEGIHKRQGVYVVSEGGLLLYVVRPSGRKRVLLSASIGEVIILTSDFLEASDDISFEMRANKDSEIYFIPEVYWNNIQAQNPKIQAYTVELLSKHMSALSSHLYEGMQNIGKQLALFLLRNFELNPTSEYIEISHELLAELLGTTREVITRNLSNLKSLGYIETGRNKIRVENLEHLREYVNDVSD